MTTLAPITDVVGLRTGTELFVGHWPGPSPVVLGLHGLTSQHGSMAALAAELQHRHGVLAPDLSGRGDSSPRAGAYGIERHAEDLVALLDTLGVERAIVAGHSMGATVAATLAALAPERVMAVVLVDGGLPPGDPAHEEGWVDGDGAGTSLPVELVPITDRLSRRFASPAEYFEFWRALPAFRSTWDDATEATFLADLRWRNDGYFTKCDPRAAVSDYRDLMLNPDGPARIATVTCPVLLIRAERGLHDDAPIIDEETVARVSGLGAPVETVLVPETNHYTIMVSARGASAVARAIEAFAAQLVTA